ncbi:MAG: hypothetical protein H8Z69_02570 [Nanohaloarchaea archaeon]|nr:hypothetical protein [Candidatus Nanohaloarchaea archaeon]
MVLYEEDAGTKEDHFFVKEDPARIYRGLKDLLVEEFDIDRIEEGKMEFNVAKPKDKIRMHAFKEKSPHTTLYFNLSFRAKRPKDIYEMERPDDIHKARVKTSAKVLTVYPGSSPIPWEPGGMKEVPEDNWDKPGLSREHKSRFQKTKLYDILTGIWYHKFYSKEIHMYEEEAEEIMVHIQNLMREKFGVEKTIHRSGSSHYSPPWS